MNDNDHEAEPLNADSAPGFNIVLVAPEIPPNSGNAIRLATATGSALHLVEPLGFSVDDARMRRAGLDYWGRAPMTVYPDVDSLIDQHDLTTKLDRCFALTPHVSRRVYDVQFQPGDWLFFGCESKGLDVPTLAKFPDTQHVRIPMRPVMRSLNLANSVAIVIFEAWRQLDFEGAV